MYDELVMDLRGNHDKYFARDLQAADAIEELSAYVELYKDGGETAMKVANDYKARIEELSAIREEQKAQIIAMAGEDKPRWIPVTERLPEEYVDVLCYCLRNGQYGCGEWCKEDNGTIYWIGLNGMIPTHWMPLPQPPEEE